MPGILKSEAERFLGMTTQGLSVRNRLADAWPTSGCLVIVVYRESDFRLSTSSGVTVAQYTGDSMSPPVAY